MIAEPSKCDLCGRMSRGEPKCRDHLPADRQAFVKLARPNDE